MGGASIYTAVNDDISDNDDSDHLAYCVTARNSFKGNEVLNIIIINDDDSYLQLLDSDDDEGAIDIDIVDSNSYKLHYV
jgi:hypothetical protein